MALPTGSIAQQLPTSQQVFAKRRQLNNGVHVTHAITT